MLYLVCGEVLSDTAGFLVDDVALADVVEEGALAVVDMPHDHHYWRTLGYIVWA